MNDEKKENKQAGNTLSRELFVSTDSEEVVPERMLDIESDPEENSANGQDKED